MFAVPANFAHSVHISPQAQFISHITLLVLAVLCVLARTLIRMHSQRFYVDDYFAFLGTASLIAGVVVRLCAVIANQKIDPPARLEVQLNQALGVLWSNTMSQILSSLTIYSVKFSFLFYFKGVLRQQPQKMKWCWCILAILVIVSPPSVFASFITCPVVTSMAIEICTLAPGYEQRKLIATYYFVAADIITALLLISIPIWILREVSLSFRKKLTIGVILCLSMFQTIIALIRGVGLQFYGTSDETWTAFWPNTEACVAIIMVCMTAFRSLFVGIQKTLNPKEVKVVNAPILWADLKVEDSFYRCSRLQRIWGTGFANSSRVEV